MGRLIRNTAILAKIEVTAGTDAAPAAATDALLVQNANFDRDYKNVDYNPMRGALGGKQSLPGTRFSKASFEVALAASGTAGTAPAWGKLLLACAFAEVTAASTVEYTPVSTAMKTLTIKYVEDGVQHSMLGCMGNVELDAQEGAAPMLKFNFIGKDGGDSALATPAMTLTAWKQPLVVTADNTGCLTLGGTYATGVITGGTTYPARGLNINMNNDVQAMPMLCGNSVDITNRDVTGSTQLELTAAQEIQLVTDVNTATMTSLSLLHGTTAGSKVLVYAPNVQRLNQKRADFNGRAHMKVDLDFVPIAGNDELRIVAL